MNPKFFKNSSEINYKLGEVKGIQLWRKLSESAVKLMEVKCSDVR